MKKVLLYLLVFASPAIVFAQTYKPLSGDSSPFFSDTNMPIGEFVRQLFTWSIGLASVLTVFMIIGGGFKYLTSAATSASETKAAKEQIRNALLGLFLLIISVFILQTINPSLTRLDAVLPTASTTVATVTERTEYCIVRVDRTINTTGMVQSESPGGCYGTRLICTQSDEYKEPVNSGGNTVTFFCRPKKVTTINDNE